MFNCRKNHQVLTLFAEARLSFKKPKKGPKSAPSDAEMEKSAADLLAKLRGEVEEKKGGGKAPESTHTDKRRHTRRIEPVEKRYDISKEEAEKIVKLKGTMESLEVKRMQASHEKIYEHYINPAFITYVEQIGKADEVFGALDMVMKHPYGLSYRSSNDNRVEIVKRSPYNDANKEIPNDFKIVLETSAGHITHVAGVDLKTKEGEIAWVESEKYTKDMRNYRERYMVEWGRYWVDSGVEAKDSFEGISDDMKRLHVLHNIEFPKRFVAMVQARGLDFELNDSRFKDIVDHQKKQGKTFDEITKEGYGAGGKLKLMVVADPKLDGVYQIWTRTNSLRKEPVRVSKEGYMLQQDANGYWKPHPRYDQAVRYGYYAKNEAVMDNLVAKEKAEVEGGMKAAEVEEKKREAAEKIRQRQEKVIAALDKADLAKLKETSNELLAVAGIDKLKEVAIASWPEWKDTIEKRKAGDEESMRKIIREQIEKEPDKFDEAGMRKFVKVLIKDSPTLVEKTAGLLDIKPDDAEKPPADNADIEEVDNSRKKLEELLERPKKE